MKRNDLLKSLETIKKKLLQQEQISPTPALSNLVSPTMYICTCLDAQGNPKNLYTTQKEAQNELNYIAETQRIRLEVYSCPTTKGWHLTKG